MERCRPLAQAPHDGEAVIGPQVDDADAVGLAVRVGRDREAAGLRRGAEEPQSGRRQE